MKSSISASLIAWAAWSMSIIMACWKWPIPPRPGAPGEEDRQIEQDDPGQQTQGQTESEASAPTGAGDWLSHSESGAERDRLEAAWLAFGGWQPGWQGSTLAPSGTPDDPTLISFAGASLARRTVNLFSVDRQNPVLTRVRRAAVPLQADPEELPHPRR
jgi:hypothetical protein